MFGGVELTFPYRSSDVTKEMPKVIRGITNSFYQAYGINTKIDTPSNKLILTKLSPLVALIDEKCADYEIKHKKLAKIYIRRAMIHGYPTTLFARDNGFYVVHKLKEKFDPEETEFLLKTIKATILKLTYDKFRVTSSISDTELRVEAEIIPADDLFVV